MTYRDDGEASLLQRDALERSLFAEEDLAERERIGAALEALDRARRVAARTRLPVIARATIASPCLETFETMAGDGAIRSCSRCDREVFDTARMTLVQVEALVASRGEEKTCVRLRKRADGTLMFADCEVGARGVRMRRVGALVAATVVAATAAALLGQPATHVRRAFGLPPARDTAEHWDPAHWDQPPHAIMGEMMIAPASAAPPAWHPTPVTAPSPLDPVARVLSLDS